MCHYPILPAPSVWGKWLLFFSEGFLQVHVFWWSMFNYVNNSLLYYIYIIIAPAGGINMTPAAMRLRMKLRSYDCAKTWSAESSTGQKRKSAHLSTEKDLGGESHPSKTTQSRRWNYKLCKLLTSVLPYPRFSCI